MGVHHSHIQPNSWVEHISIDSRANFFNNNTLFIAVRGEHFDAHAFIDQAYEKGIRFFIVEDDTVLRKYQDVEYLITSNSKQALQQIARFYRSFFDIPVIGITGSNGKTIVKEWLFQLLQDKASIALSPRSYNSQIGVPLSIFQLNDQHSLGIFEAGISTIGEMQLLNEIIQPSIGILTNIGHAHDAGFDSLQQKFNEKMRLFDGAKLIISSQVLVEQYAGNNQDRFFTWGTNNADVELRSCEVKLQTTILKIFYQSQELNISIPFTDAASLENLMHCISLMLYWGYDETIIQNKIAVLRSIPMRMTLKKLSNEAVLIDDTYSADFESLKIALDYLQRLDPPNRKTIVLSDFDQTGVASQIWISTVVDILKKYKIDRIVGIGKEWTLYKKNLSEQDLDRSFIFEEVSEAIQYLKNSIQNKETILVKGSRNAALDRIVKALEFQSHDTRIEVFIPNLISNIQYFKKHLKAGVKCMGMVKAFSYGTGAYEIASVLMKEGIDYLGVAYLDEGVELRLKGIQLPIMVMNVEAHSLERLIEYRLEPVIYSVSLWNSFISYLETQGIQNYPIHIELETGMNRLGMSEEDIREIQSQLSNPHVEIKSVFSHLSGSEDVVHDQFTLQQFELFNKIQGLIAQQVPYRFLKHILNSNGILRHPSLQMDMVRLGIGMYGLAIGNEHKSQLKSVVSLYTTIAQIKHLEDGATISYGRRGKVSGKRKIATLRVGYADGYPRALGNGLGKVWINGKAAPIIGTICMDMMMIDITDFPVVVEGDTVEVWGENISLEEISVVSGTIPYEILTGLNSRVKRVYITG